MSRHRHDSEGGGGDFVPELVVITGPSGAGKTTVARALAQLAARVDGGAAMVHIPVDELRAMVVLPDGPSRDYTAERDVWLPMLEAQLKALRDQREAGVRLVVVDGLFHDREDVARLRTLWPERFFFSFHLAVPLKLCLERNKKRSGDARLSGEEIGRLHELPVPHGAAVIEAAGRDRPHDIAERLFRKLILSGHGL